VKLDFLYCACLIPRRDKTRAQVMFDGMRLLRELAGDALILGCGVPLVPAFGLVDYCRIGCDMTLNWLGERRMQALHREVPSTRNTLLNTVYRRHLDGRAWRNDPDVFLLRDDNMKLTPEQREKLAIIDALFGGVLFTSDNVGAYDEAKRKAYERIEKLDRKCVTAIRSTPSKLVIHYRDGDKKCKLTVSTR
jgi:alpha-galactosidase